MYNYWGDGTDVGLCEPLWSIRLNCQLMTKLEMMHILQAQVQNRRQKVFNRLNT